VVSTTGGQHNTANPAKVKSFTRPILLQRWAGDAPAIVPLGFSPYSPAREYMTA